jgi:hypothetical protein
MYVAEKDRATNSDNSTLIYADIYVEDIAEAKTVDTSRYTAGTKLYVANEGALYVLGKTGGAWYGSSGTALA